MTDKLIIETQKIDGVWQLVFKGAIDERAELPEATGSTDLRIDLGGVTHINSIGVRTWCEWINKQSGRNKVIIEKSPMTMTKQFSMVKGFIAANVTVTSFYVPYFSSGTDERRDYLFRLGHEYDAKGVLTMPVVKDSNGQPMEMDVFENTYFKFLRP
jgi:ABC-type transporter Mla MlaB component